MPKRGDRRDAPLVRRAAVELVVDADHYERVVLRALRDARVSLWIATANLKDVHVEAPVGTRARARGRYVSLLERFAELAAQGVEVRLLHGALPSRPFRASLASLDVRDRAFELRHCPRVHLKVVVIDGAYVYLGSANFTGAGIGARGDGRRNFELGLATDDELLLDAVQARFERIWSGKECGACRLRSECPAPLDSVTQRETPRQAPSPGGRSGRRRTKRYTQARLGGWQKKNTR